VEPVTVEPKPEPEPEPEPLPEPEPAPSAPADPTAEMRAWADELKAIAARLDETRGLGPDVGWVVTRQAAALTSVADELLDAADELALRARLDD
jgi:outer membrane biosynthesis protein TonB